MAILSGKLNGPLAFGVAGPSAYEVAVKNGFVGSEEAWLDSLRGEPFVFEDFTPEQLASLKGKQGDPGKDGDDGFSPEITVEKAGKVTTITITDATGTYTAKINDGADGKNGQDGADGKDSVGVVIYRTTADLTDELADSNYPFMLDELDTTGGTPEVGDWIVDKYLRLYQIVDAYGDTFDGAWIATLSRDGGEAKDGGYYIPNVELLESNHLKFSYTASKEDMPEIADRYFELPGSGGNVDLGVTGATVGQTVKISEVDENGVPTAWEPVDFPSGGGSEFEEIFRLTTTEEVSTIETGIDLSQYAEIVAYCDTIPVDGTTGNTHFVWYFSKGYANRINSSLHSTQRRVHYAHITKISENRLHVYYGYGVGGVDLFATNMNINSASNVVGFTAYSIGHVIANVNDNFKFGSYMGNTMLKIGTQVIVYGRK